MENSLILIDTSLLIDLFRKTDKERTALFQLVKKGFNYFDQIVAKKAVEINTQLRQSRKQIAIPDLFIAATAMSYNLPFATLNLKHFGRVKELVIIDCQNDSLK